MLMGVCLDYGSTSPATPSVLAQSATLGECTALCPAGSVCGVAGSGEILPPELDPAAFVEHLGVGFGVAAVPLSVVFGIVAILRLVSGR